MGRAALRRCWRSLVGGTIWRYRYDQFGWTTRSSQLYESRLLRIGSPLFHFGILVVIVGHVGRPGDPEVVDRGGRGLQEIYHVNALVFGAIAGICTLVGIVILIYRRRTTGPVFMATTRNDKAMYVVLVAAIVAGLWTTLVSVGAGHEAHNYRETVSPWFRSLFVLQPDVDAMAAAPLAVPGPRPGRDAAVRASGRSPGWCTPSPPRCTTCSGPTSSTAAATTDRSRRRAAAAAGRRSAPATATR